MFKREDIDEMLELVTDCGCIKTLDCFFKNKMQEIFMTKLGGNITCRN